MHQANSLFQLQTDLIDMKVDMAVSKAIDRVLERIADLKDEMNNRFEHLEKRLDKRLTSVEHRLVAVETKLGIVNETEKEIKAKFYDSEKQLRNNMIDYSFKAGWLLLGTVLTYVLYQFHVLIK